MNKEDFNLKKQLENEIEEYNEKIALREEEIFRLNSQKMSQILSSYQVTTLIKKENDMIEHFTNRINDRFEIINNEDLIYMCDMLVNDKTLNIGHIWLIKDAFLKIKRFKEAKIDPKSYQAIKKIKPDIPASYAKIKIDISESLRFAYYSDEKITNILRMLFDDKKIRIPKEARKQDEKTKDGKIINHFQFAFSIE